MSHKWLGTRTRENLWYYWSLLLPAQQQRWDAYACKGKLQKPCDQLKPKQKHNRELRRRLTLAAPDCRRLERRLMLPPHYLNVRAHIVNWLPAWVTCDRNILFAYLVHCWPIVTAKCRCWPHSKCRGSVDSAAEHWQIAAAWIGPWLYHVIQYWLMCTISTFRYPMSRRSHVVVAFRCRLCSSMEWLLLCMAGTILIGAHIFFLYSVVDAWKVFCWIDEGIWNESRNIHL